MKDLKKEINSRFVSDRSRIEYLAEEVTKELEEMNRRTQMIENAVSLMQEAMIRMEGTLKTLRIQIEQE